jgi:hypothetical protein
LHSQTILFYFSSGFFLRKNFKKKESTHFIICNQIHTNLDGGWEPSHTGHPRVRRNSCLFFPKDQLYNILGHYSHQSIINLFSIHIIFFQCVDIILLQIQNTFDFKNTLRKHYNLRNQIILQKYNTLRNPKHFEKTLQLEKFKTLWENITTWEIQNTFDFQNTLRKNCRLRKNITHWEKRFAFKKHYNLRNSKHFEKTLQLEKLNSFCKNKTHWEKVFIYWKLVIYLL